MPDFALGEWLPDQPQIALPGLIRCENVIPTGVGYESHPGSSTVEYRAALASPCRGASGGETAEGIKYILAGTGRDQSVTPTSNPTISLSWGNQPDAWYDVTPAAPLTTFVDQGQWEFTRYGKYLLAVANGIVPQKLDVSTAPTASSEFSDLAAGCSKAGTAAVFKNFMILGNLVGRGGSGNTGNAAAIGTLENGIHWSAIGDPTSWPDVGTDTAANQQSDYQALDGSGGAVTAIVPGGEYCAVFQERALWRLDYVGSPNVFALRLIEPNVGCINQRTAVAANNMIYFASAQGFMVFDGSSVQSIGSEKVDRTWLESLDVNNTAHATSSYNPENHCIYWSIPTGGGGATELYGYQYEVGRWFRVVGDRYEWILNALSATLGGSLDGPPFDTQSMDSPPLSTINLDTLGTEVGKASLAYFDSMHRLNLFNDLDSPLGGIIETGDYEAPGGNRAVVNWIRPIYDSDGTLEVLTSGKNFPNDTVDYKLLSQRPSVGAWAGSPGNRVGGRYLRSFFYFAAGRLRSFSGFDVDLRTGGPRR